MHAKLEVKERGISVYQKLLLLALRMHGPLPPVVRPNVIFNVCVFFRRGFKDVDLTQGQCCLHCVAMSKIMNMKRQMATVAPAKRNLCETKKKTTAMKADTVGECLKIMETIKEI